MSFGKLWMLLALVAALPGLGCVDAVVPETAPAPICKCAPPALCPADLCDLQIELSPKTCTGVVSKVEVLLGDSLEPETFALGTPRRSCGTIKRGETVKMYARSDASWQWVEEIACPPAAPGDQTGVTVVRLLNCATTQK